MEDDLGGFKEIKEKVIDWYWKQEIYYFESIVQKTLNIAIKKEVLKSKQEFEAFLKTIVKTKPTSEEELQTKCFLSMIDI